MVGSIADVIVIGLLVFEASFVLFEAAVLVVIVALVAAAVVVVNTGNVVDAVVMA